MTDYILALDQGTTSSRALLFDRQGRMQALAQQEFTQHYPQPGWVEHDPEEIWRSQFEVAQAVLQQAGLTARDLAAIGIANQRETTVLWDRRTGRSVGPAIVWQCRRTVEHCEQLKAQGLEPEIRQRTGLVLDPYFSATKLAWLLAQPGVRAQAKRGELAFGTIDSWLLWRLTEGMVHATDASNASRTLLCNLHSVDWDDWLLDRFGIPREILPPIRPNVDHFGDCRLFGHRVPILAMAGDQQAALFGQGCLAPGLAKNTYGTGSFILLNIGETPGAPAQGVLSTLAWQLDAAQPPVYALEAAIFSAGATVQWLRDNLGIIDSAAQVEGLAAQLDDNGGVYLVPAFTGLGSPHWDAQARGLLIGLTRGTDRRHLARAALEAIALQGQDALAAMQAACGIRLHSLRVDGGASRNDLLLQMQADLIDVPVERPACQESTALGAAGMAGLALGWWDAPAFAQLNPVIRCFAPSITAARRAAWIKDWQRAVARSRQWLES
jgi:glycerol kinase